MTSSAWAVTSVSLKPVEVNVIEGEVFTLTIALNPDGVSNYTAKIELQYPADLVRVSSFAFKSDWLPLKQPGYDLVDNTTGVLVKTAGYPGGISSPVTFGVATFVARKGGDGVIRVGSNSLILDRNNQNIFDIKPVKVFVTVAPFVIPDKIPSGYIFTDDLAPGDKNVDVAYLQLCLQAEKLYFDEVTSFFGLKTREAVIKFKEEYFDGILFPRGFEKGTGLVGRTTREKLNEVCFVTPTIEEIEEPVKEEQVPAEVVIEEVTEEIKEKALFYTNVEFWIGATAFLALVVILLLLIIIVLLVRHTPLKYRENHNKQMLRKEEAILRQTKRYLLMNKIKTEQELQKVENKLKRFSDKDSSA
ncbi:MAG: hypothetical protein IIA83_11250 [Thaumarchaeota archaeon]|nr:hypothetical protein [Nitrososphaerota archaeon]